MYDARELTVEQIGAVLGVSRTSIYRALGTTTPPARPAAAGPARIEPAAAATVSVAEAAATLTTQLQTSAGGAPVVVRSRGRSRWFVVQADPTDPERGPVAVERPHQPEGGDRRVVPGQAQGVGRRGGVGGTAGPRRRADQLPAGVGQPGRAGRRAPRAAAVTAGLPAVRRDLSGWT